MSAASAKPEKVTLAPSRTPPVAETVSVEPACKRTLIAPLTSWVLLRHPVIRMQAVITANRPILLIGSSSNPVIISMLRHCPLGHGQAMQHLTLAQVKDFSDTS